MISTSHFGRGGCLGSTRVTARPWTWYAAEQVLGPRADRLALHGDRFSSTLLAGIADASS